MEPETWADFHDEIWALWFDFVKALLLLVAVPLHFFATKVSNGTGRALAAARNWKPVKPVQPAVFTFPHPVKGETLWP